MTRSGARTTEALAAARELDRLRGEIDALDRRLVELLNERADLALAAGRRRRRPDGRGIRDADREREVLLRVAMANDGPLPQADPGALPPAHPGDGRARGSTATPAALGPRSGLSATRSPARSGLDSRRRGVPAIRRAA